MPQPLRLSIAMATYNGARFLPQQLDSFTAQDRRPDELVVCDDGSSDATMDILQAFAATAPFAVRIERNATNLGFVRNFEKALSLCSGDVIFLSDQDDVWLPAKLARVEAEFLEDPGLKATINDMIITDGDLNHSGVTQLGTIRATGFGERRFIAGCCAAIRRDMLETLLPFPKEHFAHDSWIGDACEALGVRRILSEPLQLYRRHGSNESQWLLSDPNGVSRAQLVLKSGLASPVEAWEAYLIRLGILRRWLTDTEPRLRAIGLGPRIDAAHRFITDEESSYRGRLDLLAISRRTRWAHILRFWIRGGYAAFLGWKSAIKDMVRP
ncbi:MAG: glycosyltransferase family 2 protein [Rhodobacter sp.]|nr:glycosyltransferase family 2 protein [Rhodobacter sp.]